MSSWVVVSRTEHKDKCWKPRQDFEFAAAQKIVEVLASELNSLFANYVLGFIQKGDDYRLIALLGLVGERNLYVNEQGQWLCQYVPTAIRAYPFKFADISESGGRILCIEESHLTDDTDATALFDDEDNPASEIVVVLNFLNQCHTNRKQTKAACIALKEAGVLEPWPLIFKRGEDDEEPASIEGVHRINESALNKLSKPALIRLRDAGALRMAYAQLFSMNQLVQLSHRAQYFAQQQSKTDLEQENAGSEQEKAELAPELADIFDEEGSLNFDSL